MTDDIKALKDAEVSSDDKNGDRSNAWLPGLALMGIGVIFLLNNFTGFRLHNWWALFILFPGLGALGYAVQAYRASGHLNKDAGGAFVGALAILFTATVFLLGWNFGLVWPFYLVIAGLGALASGLAD